MTDKQEKILLAALELFANEGYTSTSTSKIARKAGVSEGLIFRHFGNKEGLLSAIIAQGEEKAKLLFADIVMETDPKKVIENILVLCEKMTENEEEMKFWKLQYKIKWETEQYGEHKMEPVKNALSKAFDKLGYKNPEQEAVHLLLSLDGIATRVYLSKVFDMRPVLAHLRDKYGL
ncbi:MAG: TetR/AcrR family transcriptional regulator [Bacteroidota bacterium]